MEKRDMALVENPLHRSPQFVGGKILRATEVEHLLLLRQEPGGDTWNFGGDILRHRKHAVNVPVQQITLLHRETAHFNRMPKIDDVNECVRHRESGGKKLEARLLDR